MAQEQTQDRMYRAEIVEVPTRPFPDQRPGTSGLRKKTRVFMQPHYLENFVQAVLDVAAAGAKAGLARETLVVGGDGRYFNREAIQRIVRMAAANGFGTVLVARSGLLSTPAMSAVIRARGAQGGLVLSASHNPGGPDADFGVKFNVRNGGPAPEAVTEEIYRVASSLARYRTIESPDIDLDREAEHALGAARVVVFDPIADYAALMESLFDFEALRRLFRGDLRMRFDAMNGITGPYAHEILERRLGAPAGTVARGTPLEDFGGVHPDPNLVHAAELVRLMDGDGAPDLGAACDGDGDRNMILGPRLLVSPGDSLAMIAEHAQASIPGYRVGLAGVARSMPTSTAVDRVAAALRIPCYETPTGWKFFGDLLDAGLCTICGEESFGTGSSHIREKDGLWAVLCWLSILARSGSSVAEVARAHWRRFGRSYFRRHDYEALDPAAAEGLVGHLRDRLAGLAGASLAGSTVASADDFAYRDPVTGAEALHGGLRIRLADGSRIVARLSGTGTEGATLRLYLERYRDDGGSGEVGAVLAPLRDAAVRLLEIRARCGRDEPTVIT
ncbi:MAG TPA: alpha-D-glucose phosphate-specific phosphoglucomutase [Usitatibacter sp.]|nr:alpha-D-glucose phosphate-specific phosphoglucomutase [Usitatibacter sp.]